ncbi:hypothetical protein SUGI_1000940 [Cryptomeria japonica]|nr:hypothetical protein SUGI_1000940 [Cryptomeria japonica]
MLNKWILLKWSLFNRGSALRGNSNGRQDYGLRPLIPLIPEKDAVAYGFTEAVVDNKSMFKLKLHSAVRSLVSFQKSDKAPELLRCN